MVTCSFHIMIDLEDKLVVMEVSCFNELIIEIIVENIVIGVITKIARRIYN